LKKTSARTQQLSNNERRQSVWIKDLASPKNDTETNRSSSLIVRPLKPVNNQSNIVSNKHSRYKFRWLFSKFRKIFDRKLSCFFDFKINFIEEINAISIPEKKLILDIVLLY
jgi:hypothetical protein